MQSTNKPYQIGITLSGGGAKGIAHLGLLKFLEEQNIKPQIASGTSMGAIVSLFYCAGYSADETLKILIDLRKHFINTLSFRKPGLLDLEKIYPFLTPFFPNQTFESLKHKLIITASNLLTAESVVFETGDPIWAALASSAFPYVFSPVTINNMYLADGGIYNNFPVDLVRNSCELLIGSLVLNVPTTTIAALNSPKSVAQRAFTLALNTKLVLSLKDCDFYINPPNLERYNMFIPDAKNLNEIFEIGYNQAAKSFETIDKNMFC